MAPLPERHWKYYPALRLASPFALGIVAGRLLETTTQLTLIPLALILLGGALFLLLPVLGRGSVAAPLFLILAASGMLAYALGERSGLESFAGASVRDAMVVGRVADDPIFRANRIELRLEVDSILYRNSVAHPHTGVLLRLYDSSAFDPGLIPRAGDLISATGTLSVPAPPGNPGELDYAGYLRSQGIGLAMVAMRSSTIHIVAREKIGWLERGMLGIRREVRSFADRFVRGEEGDIVRALLLGERDYIDAETRERFMRTGTVHLLSVSGLHVGVIALALFVAVSWLRSRWVQLVAFVLLIGFYTAIAGGAPSILRASLMASALMLARVAGRIARPLNTLGFALLVILLIHPDQLFDVGLQLSFASVAGIMILHPPLMKALEKRIGRIRRHATLRALVQMLLISICAQLFTLPLVLYHFGYLSVISLIINIPVIPLYSIALGAALAGAFAAPLLTPVAAALGGAAYLALRVAGGIVEWGAGLSFAGVELGTIALPGAILIALALLYLSFSRSFAQGGMRLSVLLLVGVGAILHGRVSEPLRESDGSLLYLLKGRSGTMVAFMRRDTVVVIETRGDSAAARSSGEALRRLVGGNAIRTLVLRDGLMPDMTVKIEGAISGMMEPTGAALASAVAATSVVAFATADVPATADALPIVPPPALLSSDARCSITMNDAPWRVVNDAPCEVALTDLPAILSNTSRRPLALVTADGMRVLQVPMLSPIDAGIVLRYDPASGRWREIRWR